MNDLVNRNASPSIVGFHFQDLVGLMLLLDLGKVKDLRSLTIEGEEDIEILNNDDTIEYYQLKATMKPFEASMTAEMKKALLSLNDDAKRATESNQEIVFLAYVSNSSAPLGKKNGAEIFKSSYGNYSYYDLPDSQKKQIEKYLPEESLIDLQRLHIMKVHFAGSDEQTKRQELSRRIDTYIEATGISTFHKRIITDALISLVSQSAEDKKAVVSKEHLLSHTVVTELFQEPDWEAFFERYEVDEGNEKYIKSRYQEIIELILIHFTVVSVIQRNFRDFIKENPTIKRSMRKEKFVNEEYEFVKHRLGMTDERDNDIAKLISEVIITSTSTTDKVREVIGL